MLTKFGLWLIFHKDIRLCKTNKFCTKWFWPTLINLGFVTIGPSVRCSIANLQKKVTKTNY